MYPGLVSCPFYAIPIYPFKFMKFFIYLYIYRQRGPVVRLGGLAPACPIIPTCIYLSKASCMIDRE